MANKRNGASPSVNIRIEDVSFIQNTQGLNQTTLGVVGETVKGRAFTPIFVDTYDSYQQFFGGLDPCKFEGTQQPIYETSYIAKQFLEDSESLYVTRVLGLSGYDAGDAWSIAFGAALDPETVETLGTSAFTVEVQYVNGELNEVDFSNSVLQTLYDSGEIDDTVFGGSALLTGNTISQSNAFYGDCEGGFIGARFNATSTERTEHTICITGTTTQSSSSTINEVTQTCTVVYGVGTITYNSTFVIDVVSAIVLVNTDTNELTVVSNGTLQIDGGTLTHESDGSITIEDSTIFLPGGEIISGGNYKICDLEGNDALYDCNTIDGVNYTITTGTTVTSIPVITTGTTLVTADIPSGIINITFSGNVTTLTGNSYTDIDGTIITTLRSYGSYDGSENLSFQVKGNVMSIAPVSGSKINPLDDFMLSGIKTDGSPFSYIVSLDRTKKNYIGRVFGGSFIQCCPSKTPFYVEENFITMFENLIASGKVDCIKSSICYSAIVNDFKTEYRGAVTPWIVSEVRGNKVFRLFRFHTFSHGNAANEDIKVSIENIRPDRRDFDVVIRSFYDTDRRPVVLERYSRVSLSKTSNNFIGLAMGTADGEYQLQSKYAILELAAECLDDSFPAGFEGYLVRDVGDCKFPQMTYKTSYAASDRVRNVYLGISDVVGIEQDMFNFKGLPHNPELVEYSGLTHGYHLDVDATSVDVDGIDYDVIFDVGDYSFKNEAELVGTDYENILARKFTLAPFGGFDGWDIHRKTRTNTDSYSKGASLGVLGTTVGNFTAYVLDDGSTGITSDYYAYLKGIKMFDNPESVIIDLLATPNVNNIDNSDLVEETIEMIEQDRCDAFYVFTTIDHNVANEALSVTDLSDNNDGLFDTPYAGTYAYWGQYNDTENNTRIYLPPTAEVMRIFAYTDRISAPWYAGAGTTRALTNFLNVRKKPRETDRDILYENRVNSLFYDRGNIFVFGNKTMQVADSLLSQISIVRMVLYLRRQISRLGIALLFEPNDATIRVKFERQIRQILNDVVTKRGLYNFDIALSSDPASLDRGELNGVITLYPTPSLEEINLTFKVTPSSAQFNVA